MASPINNTYAQTQTVINTPGGGNTMVQYNKNGTFAGDNGFKYDSKLQSMSILGNINIGGWVKGKIYTNKYNFFLTGGNSGQVLSTDGTGNLSWVDQTGGGGGSNYGNSNVASYLPTYTGNITGGNVTVTGQLRGNTVYVTSTGTAINASQGNILTNEVTGTKLNLMSGLYTASVTSGATSNYSLTLPTTAGTNGQVLTTNGSGVLSWNTVTSGSSSNISNGSSTVNIPTSNGDIVINSAPTSNVELTTASLTSVTAPCYIGLSTEYVADTEFNDDITAVQVGWTIIVNSVTYTVTYIDPAPPANQYRITVDGAAGFVSGTSYTFTNPVPVEHTWSINQFGTLTTPAGGTINQINNDFKIEVTGTDVIDLRTGGGDFILDAEGNININGPINSSTGVARLDLTGGNVYLTSTDNDTTVLAMNTTRVQMYAGVDVSLTSGVLLPQLETDYTDSRTMLEESFTQNSGEAGYPWGITLPVSYLTYNELILLAPDTFPNQAACTVQANNTQNTWELWQDTIAQSNVRITSNELTWTFDSEGLLTLPGGNVLIDPTSDNFEVRGAQSINFEANAVVNIYTDTSNNGWQWQFGDDGTLTSPNSVVQNTSGSVTCNAGAPTVIYTGSSTGKTTLKLLIQVEGAEVLGQQWDTQSCEMVVARGLRNNTVVGSVYGLAYTSTNPLATFNAIWNNATSRIEITCTPASLTLSVEARVTVTEMITSA